MSYHIQISSLLLAKIIQFKCTYSLFIAEGFNFFSFAPCSVISVQFRANDRAHRRDETREEEAEEEKFRRLNARLPFQ